ncbi:MAG: hypothetical protein ABEJ04_05665 [Halobacteriaceae archaeon]
MSDYRPSADWQRESVNAPAASPEGETERESDDSEKGASPLAQPGD